mmetsp:Transcript_80363/g.215457  ORF Transcript_80363/g.215457 Transcript_80363/m.215457 type:complete len:306 (+) Transcript_80363:2404-3321(+)
MAHNVLCPRNASHIQHAGLIHGSEELLGSLGRVQAGLQKRSQRPFELWCLLKRLARGCGERRRAEEVYNEHKGRVGFRVFLIKCQRLEGGAFGEERLHRRVEVEVGHVRHGLAQLVEDVLNIEKSADALVKINARLPLGLGQDADRAGNDGQGRRDVGQCLVDFRAEENLLENWVEAPWFDHVQVRDELAVGHQPIDEAPDIPPPHEGQDALELLRCLLGGLEFLVESSVEDLPLDFDLARRGLEVGLSWRAFPPQRGALDHTPQLLGDCQCDLNQAQLDAGLVALLLRHTPGHGESREKHDEGL